MQILKANAALFNKTPFNFFFSYWVLVTQPWSNSVTVPAFKLVFIADGRKSTNIEQMETAGRVLPLAVFNWFVFGLKECNKYLTRKNVLNSQDLIWS